MMTYQAVRRHTLRRRSLGDEPGRERTHGAGSPLGVDGESYPLNVIVSGQAGCREEQSEVSSVL
jgi:hypothetical protein